MNRILAIGIFISTFLFLPSVFADSVNLKNGNTIEGNIVEKTDKYVKIDSAGVSLTYYWDEIKSIDQNNSSLTTQQASVIPLKSEAVVNTDTDEKDPQKILGKVKALYQSLATYKTHGTVVADIGSTKINTDFNIILQKPNLYLISWTQNTSMGTGGMTQSGAVWSDGTQPYLYMGVEGSYAKMKSDEMALSGATGISGGAAFTIPMIFLSVSKAPFVIFDRLVNPVLEGAEKVDNDDCYVISASSSSSKKETFWISKSKYLIRKYSRSLEVPPGMKMPEITDEQIEKIMKATGIEDTAANRQRMKEQMKMAEGFIKNVKMHGSSTETYEDISSPEISKTEFKFQVPEGVVLKESLF